MTATAPRGSQCTVRAVASTALVLAAWTTASAANRAIEDIRPTRANGVETIDVVMSCPVDYLDHAPIAGEELRIRIGLASECAETIGTGIRAELHEPPRSTVASVRQVLFDTRDGRTATVTVAVTPPQQFTVSQGRARNVVHVELRRADAAALDPYLTTRLPSAEPAPRAAAAPPTTEPEPTRAPLRLVQRPAERRERFALQLAAEKSVAVPMAAFIATQGATSHTLYVNRHEEADGRWEELRLGFFATEREARERAASLAAPYSNSLVVVASPDEQDRAAAAPVLPGASSPASPERGADEPAAAPLPPLSAERIAELTAQADEAMLAGDHDTAIRSYTRLLAEPEFTARREARERLGLARERKGQLAQARLEYSAYLLEFPDGPDSERVQQRLAGLASADVPARVALDEPRVAESNWQIDGGVAQYVRYAEIGYEHPGSKLAERSTLISNVNMLVRRNGERFAMLQRFDAAYHYNLLDAAESSAPADQLHVTNAYVDLTDAKHGWEARVGRQARYGSGVVGRFDGAHVSYQWKPDIALNLALGHPVDYSRRAIDSGRRFVGLSADLDALVREWDFSFFGILQDVDGIADREAVGAEARYRGERWHVVGAVDADLSYSVLNSALVSATWRATDKLMLNGRFNAGASPFIATRNALIGQPVATIDEMLDVYTEAQLRRIARNRTAQVETATVGLSRPFFDRFQLNADVGYYDFEGTVASAGVVALPATGRQSYLNLGFVGSSLFKDGDTALFGLRHVDFSTAAQDTLTFDLRLPTRGKLRLNPRIDVSSRRSVDGSSEQVLVAPMLRMTLRWPRRHQFELEMGARRSSRELALLGFEAAVPQEETTEKFFNVGYWWEL